MHTSFRLLLLLSIGAAAACGDSDTSAPAPAAASGKHVDAATAGSISGTVLFEGVAPPVETIRMTSDRNCVQSAGPNPQSDAILIGEDHGVRNAFVYIKEGLDAGYVFDTPTTPVVLDQLGCHYTPRVFGVRVGQPIEVVNSDPTFHNVHALPMVNQEFNQGQPVQHSKLSRVFTAPEVMVRFKCDAHSWMMAWAGVLPHPYFAVSGDAGKFAIRNLPPGTYTIEAWHERLGTRTTRVTVGPSEAQSASFTFTPPAK